MSWSSARVRDDWGGRLLKARAVVVLPETTLQAYERVTASAGGGEAELAAAMAAAAEIRAKAEEEGRQEGRRAGERQGYAEGLRRGSEAAQAVMVEAMAEAGGLRADAAADLGRLACEIASHLLGVAVAFEPDVVAERVARILEESQPLGVVEIAVHPLDLQAVRQAKLRWQSQTAGEVALGVVPDPDLGPGECRVRTRSGDIEWRWPERLAQMDQAMQEVARRYGLDG